MKKNAVMKWDEQMEKDAQIATKMEEGVGGGNFFSTKSGTLSWMDNPMPNNEIVVVVIDSILENVYYEGRYDPDNPGAPVCYAFGRDAKEMVPHDNCFEAGTAVSKTCDACENNKFGTADTGKGKACKNDINKDGDIEFITDPKHYENEQEGFLKVPVMSVKGFAGFVKRVSASLKRPPHES
jgi:hypothetical protein